MDTNTAPLGSEDTTPGSRACVRVRAFLAGSGGPASRARIRAPHCFLSPFLVISLSAGPPLGWGCPACGCSCVFYFFFIFILRPPCPLRFEFAGPGCLGPWRLAPPPLSSFFSLFPSPPPCVFCCFFFSPVFVFVFSSFSLFFLCCGVLVVRCSVLLCPELWGVLVCVAVGLVLRRGLLCACALSFGAPCLCLFPLCCCLLCCACPLALCWRVALPCAASGGCRVVLPASPASGVLRGFFFPRLSGVCWLWSPPPRLVVVSAVVLCRASCRVVLWSVVCSVLCPVLCGVFVLG